MTELIMKTVRQYGNYKNYFDELKLIAHRYAKVKNYIYSRYASINSLLIIENYKKEIRNVWVKTKFAEQWKIPARYWRLAIDESVANIKSLWSNAKEKIKKRVNCNLNLTHEEKKYIFYILKSNKILYSILTRNNFVKPEKLQSLEIREQYIHNLIRRYIRKYKGKTPHTKKSTSFMIDDCMYNYSLDRNINYINIMSLKRGKRFQIQLKDKNMYNKTLRVVLKNKHIEIHKPLQIKAKKAHNTEKVIGIDKGIRFMLFTSEGKFYGEELNNLSLQKIQYFHALNKRRNKIRSIMKKHMEKGDIEKAKKIENNNLGKIKYKNVKNRRDKKLKGYINYNLNLFFKNETPSEIVLEDLNFIRWKAKLPKSVKRQFSQWAKGYLHERLIYKAQLKSIAHTIVNPCYTSQICHKCKQFGQRKGIVFTCNQCGSINADYNASINILYRKYDEEINRYTHHKKVKEILYKRIENQIT